MLTLPKAKKSRVKKAKKSRVYNATACNFHQEAFHLDNKWMYDLVNYTPRSESEFFDSDSAKPSIPENDVIYEVSLIKGLEPIELDWDFEEDIEPDSDGSISKELTEAKQSKGLDTTEFDLDFTEEVEPDVDGSLAKELTKAKQKFFEDNERQLKYEADAEWMRDNYKYLILAQKEANKLKKGYNKANWEDIDQEAKLALLEALDSYEPKLYEHEHRHTHKNKQDLSCGHVHEKARKYPITHYHKHKHTVSMEYWIRLVVKRMVLNFIYSQMDMAGISTRVRSEDQKILDMYYGGGGGDIGLTATKMNRKVRRVREVLYRPTIESLNFIDEDTGLELIDNITAMDENNFSQPTSYRESLLIEALSILYQEELILVSMYHEFALPNKYTMVLEQDDFGGIETAKDKVSFEMIAKHLGKSKTTVIRNYHKALKKLLAFYGSKGCV